MVTKRERKVIVVSELVNCRRAMNSDIFATSGSRPASHTTNYEAHYKQQQQAQSHCQEHPPWYWPPLVGCCALTLPLPLDEMK